MVLTELSNIKIVIQYMCTIFAVKFVRFSAAGLLLLINMSAVGQKTGSLMRRYARKHERSPISRRMLAVCGTLLITRITGLTRLKAQYFRKNWTGHIGQAS